MRNRRLDRKRRSPVSGHALAEACHEAGHYHTARLVPDRTAHQVVISEHEGGWPRAPFTLIRTPRPARRTAGQRVARGAAPDGTARKVEQGRRFGPEGGTMRRVLCLAVLAGLLARPEAWPAFSVRAEPAHEAALWRAVDAVVSTDRAVAPSLRLMALSGDVVDLRQLRGRVVLVYFWASW